MLRKQPSEEKQLAASYHTLACAAAFLFVLQIFVDMEEPADLRLGFVLPWNYRWMIPGPGLLSW
jgi:hypothetical protein